MNFPFICSNIPAAPAYGLYISQLIRYSRACGSYQDFLDRGFLLTRRLLNQGFLFVKLKSSLRKVVWSPPCLFWQLWNICVTNHPRYDPLVVNTSRSFPHSWLITAFVTRLTRRVSLVEHELLTLPKHLSSFFFWPLWCLFFFDIRILITPLVSSNSSSDTFHFYCGNLTCRPPIVITYSYTIDCWLILVM